MNTSVECEIPEVMRLHIQLPCWRDQFMRLYLQLFEFFGREWQTFLNDRTYEDLAASIRVFDYADEDEYNRIVSRLDPESEMYKHCVQRAEKLVWEAREVRRVAAMGDTTLATSMLLRLDVSIRAAVVYRLFTDYIQGTEQEDA